ncbi:hypothetical protein Tco_0186520 [Tanacetum coccineum]
MDPNSSLEKICSGDNVIEIPSDKVEGSGDWNSPEYQDTTGSKEKKVMNAFSFYRMETDEISERYIAPCFGELYFVKFIINPEEDDFEPGIILGRSFLRLAKGVVDFGNEVITIYPEPDLFEEDSEKIGKSLDDWDQLLDFNIDNVPKFREELPPFVCKMGKSNRNKKRAMDNPNLFYQDIGTSSSSGRHLTQEEAEKEALAIRISQRYALLEEERPVIKTMAYHEKYKKILDEIWKDKKDDPGAFIFPIRLEGKVNENALADSGSDINTMPYRIFETLGKEDIKKIDKGITMINHTQAEAMGKLSNDHCQVGETTMIATFLILYIPIDRDAPIVVAARFDVLRTVESDSDDEEEYVIKRNKFGAPIYGPKPALYLNCTNPEDRSSAIQILTTPFRKISVWKKAVSFLGSLHVPLKQVNWKPDHKGCYTNEEATEQWRAKIRLTDPYGNIYIQGFTTKKIDRKLLKYHKFSDIMSPNWFME